MIFFLPMDKSKYWYDYNRNDPDRENPFTDAFDHMMGEMVVGGGNTASESTDRYCNVHRSVIIA